MPDFDTRTPRGSDEPNRFAIRSTANKLRGLLNPHKHRVLLLAAKLGRPLSATKLRVLSIASSLGRKWAAHERRNLSIVGGLLIVIAAASAWVPIDLFVYSSGGFSISQLEANEANLKPLAACDLSWGGHRQEVPDEVSSGKKVVFQRAPRNTASSGGSTSDHPGTGMYVVNADGSGLTELTRSTAAELGIPDSLLLGDREIESIIDSSAVASSEQGLPSFCSPDGKKIVSVKTTTKEAPDDDSSAPPDDRDISVRTSAGTTDLSDPGYDYDNESIPIFSPDSRKLVFMKGEQIYVANADGSDQMKLVDKMRYNEAPVFSPDSEKVAFVSDTPGPPDSIDLYVIDVDGTGLTRLTHNTKRFGDGYSTQEHVDASGGIRFSPDSKKIAFVRYRIAYTAYTPSGPRDVTPPAEYVDLYVVNVDGSGLTRLTHTEALQEKVVAWAGR